MLNSKVQVSDDVVAREVSGETMLLDLASGKYFGLNAVGGRFWQLLEQGQSTEQARDTLLEEFEVEPEQLDKDLSALLDQLSETGLISIG